MEHHAEQKVIVFLQLTDYSLIGMENNTHTIDWQQNRSMKNHQHTWHIKIIKRMVYFKSNQHYKN